MSGGTDGTARQPRSFPQHAESNFLHIRPARRLLKVSQGVQTRSYVYNSLGQLTSATLPESGATAYTYTNFGLVYQRTEREAWYYLQL